MAVEYSAGQLTAINSRKKDLLISASAGSGKTAVLIGRIISLITDPEDPIDLDRILVVTFTRAAAAEMKDRLSSRLEELLEADPDNERLQRQSVMIHHAQVSTIDSFCGFIIRNYFHLTDLDPGYRTLEEDESRFMRSEIIAEVLEEAYEEGNESFLGFAADYFTGKSDRRMEEEILALYEKASASVRPEKWLEKCASDWELAEDITEENVKDLPFVRLLAKEAGEQIAEAYALAQANLEAANEAGGPFGYKENFEDDLAQVGKLAAAEDMDELSRALAGFAPGRLSTKKQPGVSDEAKEAAKNRRERIKAIVKTVKEKYCRADSRTILSEMKITAPYVKELTRLTLRFSELFAKRKLERGLCDFADLEHYALKILYEENEAGELVRSAAARELAARFREVMTDEYQDSNEIQEYILSAVSGSEEGIHDRFMVGDVKQSIYSFRQARPEIFLEKYNEYASAPDTAVRVDLHDNYRSRSQVTESVNAICAPVMIKELGGLAYDENAALHAKAEFPPCPDERLYNTELILLDSKDPAFADPDEPLDKTEAEAALAAERIRELVGKLPVYDKETKDYRPAQYRDIVVMFRASGAFETYSRVFADRGIPAYAASRSGYFGTAEIRTVLNYLRILDNPDQDIPFAAVMFSPIGGFTTEEMARIRMKSPESSYYRACLNYDEKDDLAGKLQGFLGQFDGLRATVRYTPVHELIRNLCRESGYFAYASAMPAGEQREANLKMLISKAERFGKVNYQGLFHFIRYIEQLEKYKIDDGEVNLFAEGADTVRLMTIHSAKGLEFPIVFLCGCSHGFNTIDMKKEILIHSKYGIGLRAVDRANRKKADTAYRSFIETELKKDMLSEELRVLYVALTRAKEKLIMTGTADLESKVKKCAELAAAGKETVPYTTVAGAGSYLDWILYALSGQACFSALYSLFGIDRTLSGKELPVNIYFRAAADAAKGTGDTDGQQTNAVQDDSENARREREELAAALDRIEGFEYPCRDRALIPGKLTVSQLKRMGLNIYEEDIEEAYAREPVVIPYLPAFAREDAKTRLSGAAKGTVYHSVLEKLDLRKLDPDAPAGELYKAAAGQIEEMARAGRFTEAEKEGIRVMDFVTFVRSELGRRMRRAQFDGTLKREQPFTMAVPASQLNEEWSSEENVLIQGIIDAYFFEDDGIVIVDYKTDFVDKGPEELIDKYERQLYYYEQALNASSGAKVKEKIIYSIYLGTQIII